MHAADDDNDDAGDDEMRIMMTMMFLLLSQLVDTDDEADAQSNSSGPRSVTPIEVSTPSRLGPVGENNAHEEHTPCTPSVSLHEDDNEVRR